MNNSNNIKIEYFRPNFSIKMLFNYLFKDTLARYFSDEHLKTVLPELKGEVIEIGSTSYRNYYKELSTNIDNFIKTNLYPDSDEILKMDATNIDFEDNSKDGVLCLNVLEHIEDYQAALNEFHRILKKGGKLILSVPFLFCIHAAPSDYHRLTHYAYENLLKDFGQVKITSIGNKFFATAHFLQGKEWTGPVPTKNNLLIRLLGSVFYILGHFNQKKDTYPIMYNIVAIK